MASPTLSELCPYNNYCTSNASMVENTHAVRNARVRKTVGGEVTAVQIKTTP